MPEGHIELIEIACVRNVSEVDGLRSLFFLKIREFKMLCCCYTVAQGDSTVRFIVQNNENTCDTSSEDATDLMLHVSNVWTKWLENNKRKVATEILSLTQFRMKMSLNIRRIFQTYKETTIL